MALIDVDPFNDKGIWPIGFVYFLIGIIMVNNLIYSNIYVSNVILVLDGLTNLRA